MKKTATKKHQKRHIIGRPRRIHPTFGLVMVLLWTIVVICTAIISMNYFRSHRTLSIHRNGADLTIKTVDYDRVGAPPFDAPEGWRFVIVDVALQNNRTTVFNFAPVVQTYITVDGGNKYYMSPTLLAYPIVAGEVKPGQKVSGTLSYLVPIKSKGLTFNFEP